MSENVANNVAQREMQDLTEKWKNGTLEEDFYYVKNKACLGVEIDYYHILHNGIKYWSGCEDEDVEEILTPVPDYNHFVELTEKANQFSQMVKKVKKLEKQLKEANNLLLGFLDENICSFDHNGYCQEHSSTEPDYRCIQQQLKWYFKKYEVLK